MQKASSAFRPRKMLASLESGHPKDASQQSAKFLVRVRWSRHRRNGVKEVKRNCGELRNILRRCYRRLWIAEFEASQAECDAQLIISEYIAPFGGINLALSPALSLSEET